ncbi:MAG TPA: M48 family metalloprotease [Burkholderiales bacterium]|nr:M48 family metalloprotease [Burkholderiales bacterium]
MRSIAEYHDLIARLERLAAEAPTRYLWRVGLLALLGIGFIAAAFVVAAGLVIGVVALILISKKFVLIKIAWIPLVFAWMILKAMWVRIPPPEGRLLARGEAPQLFAEIEAVRKAVGAQRIHRVVVTPDFNAAVAQVPRLGLLGWPHNYLVVGLPLMASLAREEFRAVLAHEFGHLSRHHARFGNWIYRIRQTWYRLLAILEHEGGLSTRMFAKFFEWYAPYFNAYSFVLARANEYEADRASARVAGAGAAGSALAAVHAKAAYLDSQYWEKLWAGVRDRAEPPAAPYSELLARCKHVPAEVGKAYAKVALDATSDLNDTHPSLAERLQALGVPAQMRFELERSAADELLGPALAKLAAEQDRRWFEQVAPAWRERHRTVAEERKRCDALDAHAQEGELALEAAWERARLAESLDGRLAALPLYRRLVERHPEHVPAVYTYGRVLLQGGDEQGVALVERAMALDAEAEQSGAALLFEFYRARKDVAGMDRWHARLDELAGTRAKAHAELTRFEPKDPLEAHGVSGPTLAKLAAVIAEIRKVKRAWLVRKHGGHLPKVPGYLLLLEFAWTSHLTGGRNRAVRAVFDRFAVDEDGPVVIRDAAESRRLRKAVATVPGALIFERH